MQPWLFACCCSRALGLSGVYPQGNLGIAFLCWRLPLARTQQPIPGLSPDHRKAAIYSYRATKGLAGRSFLQPPFPAAQPAAGMFFTQNPLNPPFLWPDLTNRLTKGSLGVKTEKKAKTLGTGSLTNGILTAGTSCHSKTASASRSFGLEKQQQRCARGSLRRARAWRESAPHWFTCGRLLAAHHPGTNTVTSIAAHTAAVPMPGRAPTTC